MRSGQPQLPSSQSSFLLTLLFRSPSLLHLYPLPPLLFLLTISASLHTICHLQFPFVPYLIPFLYTLSSFPPLAFVFCFPFFTLHRIVSFPHFPLLNSFPFFELPIKDSVFYFILFLLLFASPILPYASISFCILLPFF